MSILIGSAILLTSSLILNDYLFSIYNTEYLFRLQYQEYYEIILIVFGLFLIKNKKYKIMGFLILLFIQLSEFCYFQYFGTNIQPIGFYQIVMNGGEVWLSFIDEIDSMIIPLLITVIMGAISLIILLKTSFLSIGRYSSVLGLLLIVSVLIYNLNTTYENLHSKSGKLWHKQAKRILPIPGHLSIVNFIRAYNYFIIGILPKKIFSDHSNFNFKPLFIPQVTNINPEANIILIIGESLRAKNLSLLGYSKNTTPKLNKIKNLYASTIYAGGTMTKSSVSALLNRVKYPGDTMQIQTQKNCLFQLAKKNGFVTHFYSAQSRGQLKILQNFICKKYINFYESKTSLKKKMKNLSKYDISLIDAIKDIDLNQKNHFIVLQQRGSHSPYKKQYPKEFEIFKQPYDNTVLYTDHVLTSIYEYLKRNSTKPTYIIYTSDHGELLHEHGRNGHGWFYSEVYQVPFIFYALNIKDEKKLDKIYSHFQVSNLISNLLGYDTATKIIKDIYVNGSDVDALAGYLHIGIDENGKEKFIKKIK